MFFYYITTILKYIRFYLEEQNKTITYLSKHSFISGLLFNIVQTKLKNKEYINK